MVEWYEAYADYNDEARRLEEVLRAAAAAIDYDGPLDFRLAVRAHDVGGGHQTKKPG